MMSEVFRSDLFKLRKIRSFRVCLIVAFVLGLLMSVLYYIAWQELNKTMEETLMYIESLGDYSKVVMEEVAKIQEAQKAEYEAEQAKLKA